MAAVVVIPWTVHIRITATTVAIIATMVEAMTKIIKARHQPAPKNSDAALTALNSADRLALKC
jgi:hypothetical protein